MENKIRVFCDESGSIPKCRRDRFFSICIVKPIQIKKLMKIFKNWKKKYCKLKEINIKNEIKGSSLSPHDINIIIQKMLPKVKIVYAWFNAKNVKEKLLSNAKLTNNFLIWLAIQKMIEIEKNNNIIITMEIDVMNNSIESMKSLEDYINLRLFENKDRNSVTTSYIDSKKSWAIQVADIFSNFVYRRLCDNEKKELDEIPQIFERKVY